MVRPVARPAPWSMELEATVMPTMRPKGTTPISQGSIARAPAARSGRTSGVVAVTGTSSAVVAVMGDLRAGGLRGRPGGPGRPRRGVSPGGDVDGDGHPVGDHVVDGGAL